MYGYILVTNTIPIISVESNPNTIMKLLQKPNCQQEVWSCQPKISQTEAKIWRKKTQLRTLFETRFVLPKSSKLRKLQKIPNFEFETNWVRSNTTKYLYSIYPRCNMLYINAPILSFYILHAPMPRIVQKIPWNLF